jgi:hypothetical protein
LATTLLCLAFQDGQGLNLMKVVSEGVKAVVKDTIRSNAEPKMFDDVHLPSDMSIKDRLKNTAQFSIRTNIDVVSYGIGFDGPKKLLREYITNKDKPGKETVRRDEGWRRVYVATINDVIKVKTDDPDPCEGYMYFGNQDYCKSLGMLCKVNPFWASALTVTNDDKYFELNAHAPDSDTKYSKICSHFTDPSHRINVRFNKDMTINRITDFSSGKEVVVPENEWNYYASGACYNVFCYVSSVHALIHVLHYLMTAAIITSTRNDDSLAGWANPYDDNIAIKYLEVSALLFDSNVGDNDAKLLTGKNGFGLTKATMGPLREILCDWGSFKTADEYMKKFLLKDIYTTAKNPEDVIKSAGLLTEFQKHIDNVTPFAEELSAAFKKNNERAHKDCEKSIKSFMSDCGKGVSSIDSISSWLQLMCCTGITHGSTLSYTRMCLMPEIMRWRDINSKTFTELDVTIMEASAGTVDGMTVDRHVFTSEIKYGFKWDTKGIAKPVFDVLKKYDDMAEELKVAYIKELEENPDLREFGWILTDHCPDGYDGKQHTITTYI